MYSYLCIFLKYTTTLSQLYTEYIMEGSSASFIKNDNKFVVQGLCNINKSNSCSSCLFEISSLEFVSDISFYEFLILTTSLLEAITDKSVCCTAKEIKGLTIDWMVYNRPTEDICDKLYSFLDIINNSTTITGLLQSIYLVIEFYNT